MKIYTYPSKSAENKLTSIVNRGLEFKEKDVRELTRIYRELKNKSSPYAYKIRKQLEKTLVTLEDMNLVLQDTEIKSLIKKGLDALKQEKEC